MDVHVVDIRGTYQDMQTVRKLAVKRSLAKISGMLSAIVVGPKGAEYFIKFYGPEDSGEIQNLHLASSSKR